MFVNLRRFNIKLNPKKYIFEVPKGKLLGYIVSERGIEANPEKIVAISNMGPIRNVKGVQRLTVAWRPSVASSPGSANGGCHSISSSKRRTPLSGLRKPSRLSKASKHP